MISLALIGCGDVAESGHLPTILRHDRFRLAAVCDVDAARARPFAELAGGVPAYTDWRALLAQEQGLDGVVLALPPEASPDVAIEALRRGLAVLDEKPLAATVADGRRLQRTIEETKGVYQIGFVLRYGDWVDYIRQLAPRLGSPLQINIEVYDERLNPADPIHLARIQSFLKNSSAMTHEGSHVIDYVSLWNHSPWTRASSVAQKTCPSFSGPNVWRSKIELADRSTLDVKIAWLLPKIPESTVTLVGPEGCVEFNCVTGKGLVKVGGDEQPFELPPLAPHWGRQYHAFAEAIERGRADDATVHDGLRALEATAACELSARNGVSVTPNDLAENLGLPREVSGTPASSEGSARPGARIETSL
jgi:myo-inositol 2-dehydrogenase / D-chiro-inositol 1-dehydrogenase